ncbi:MAG TPA: ribosome biogenesis GTP-binding protein YihA/YsxC [Chitinophagaceae bacterium]|nr:ribosome biogenesis GTP-binding protein YihA/YsxC [Chitinophagaceae bacterium]
MIITKAEYLSSEVDWKACPGGNFPEYAFIGRSNVGKSSLINMLTGKHNLARTSGTPGKTRTINHYLVNDSWYLADLPGYGYAKVSASERKKWEEMIRLYLCGRPNLVQVFALVDARLEPQQIDLEFMNRLGAWKIPFLILFTKTDKVRPLKLKAHVNAFLQKMEASWEVLPDHLLTSAQDRSGKKEILDRIAAGNLEFHPGIKIPGSGNKSN